MKTLYLVLALLLTTTFVNSQVECVMCYDQTDVLSTGVSNLILNGSFESGCSGDYDYICPASGALMCDVDNWTCSYGGIYTYAMNYSLSGGFNQIVDGSRAVYMGNWYGNYCSSTEYDMSCISVEDCVVEGIPENFPNAEVDYGESNGVTLHQTVSGLTPGHGYVLEFWSGGESGFTNPGIFGLDLGFGIMYLQCLMTDAFNPTTGRRYVIQFFATSASHTFTFHNWGHSCDTCTELIVDDVKLYDIDELPAELDNCLVGIEMNNPPLQVNVFPNPAEDELTISVSSQEKYTFELMDASGRILISETLLGSSKKDISALAPGIYSYRISNSHQVSKSGTLLKS